MSIISPYMERGQSSAHIWKEGDLQPIYGKRVVFSPYMERGPSLHPPPPADLFPSHLGPFLPPLPPLPPLAASAADYQMWIEALKPFSASTQMDRTMSFAGSGSRGFEDDDDDNDDESARMPTMAGMMAGVSCCALSFILRAILVRWLV